jgi:putative DNA primase/helicase
VAETWLREILANGPVLVRRIDSEAKEAGLSWTTVRRAGEGLGIITQKTGYEGGWAWRLPDEPGEEIEL